MIRCQRTNSEVSSNPTSYGWASNRPEAAETPAPQQFAVPPAMPPAMSPPPNMAGVTMQSYQDLPPPAYAPAPTYAPAPAYAPPAYAPSYR